MLRHGTALELCSLIVNRMGWSADSEPSRRVKHYKVGTTLLRASDGVHGNEPSPPTPQRRFAGHDVHGELADVVYDVLVSGHSLATGSGGTSMTLQEVNAALDQLAAAAGDQAAQKSIMLQLLFRCSPLEIKWLIRIILKHGMNLRVRTANFLRWLHPSANKAHKTCGSLQTLLGMPQLRNPLVTLNPELTVGRAFLPQKCERLDADVMYGASQVVLAGCTAFIEEKLDGERALIHVQWDKGVQSVSLLSRRGNPRPKLLAVLRPYIQAVVPDGVSVVLDGEVVAWDTAQQRMAPFGYNLSHAEEELRARSDGGALPSIRIMYRVFDLLFLQAWAQHPGYDGCIAHLPLLQRRKLLVGLLCGSTLQVACAPGMPLPQRLEVHPVQLLPAGSVSTRWRALRGAFQKVMQQHGEGLVVKSVDAPYVCDGRKAAGWLKVKPEYMAGFYDSMDMVAVAGFFGEGHRRTKLLSHFLLAVRDDSAPTVATSVMGHGSTSPVVAQMPTRWRVVAKVGTGYSLDELRELLPHFTSISTPVPHAAPYKPSQTSKHSTESASPAPCVFPRDIFGESWEPKSDMLPDVLLDPTRSVVFEVIGAQFLRDVKGKYPAGVSLRFPRVLRIRRDKMPQEVNSWQEVQALLRSNNGMLRRKSPEEPRKRSRGASSTRNPALKSARRQGAGSRGVPADMRPLGLVPQTGGAEAQLLQGYTVVVPYVQPGYWQSTGAPGMQSAKAVQQAVTDLGGAVLTTMPRRIPDKCFVLVPPAAHSIAAIKAYVQLARVDILFPTWLARCRTARELQPIEPCHGIYFAPSTRRRMAAIGDTITGAVWHRQMEDAEATAVWDRFCASTLLPPAGAHRSDAILNLASSAPDTQGIQRHLPKHVLESVAPEIAAAVFSVATCLSWSGHVLYFDRHAAPGSGPAAAASASRREPVSGDLRTKALKTLQAEAAWRSVGGAVAMEPSSGALTAVVCDPACAAEGVAGPTIDVLHPGGVIDFVGRAAEKAQAVVAVTAAMSERIAALREFCAWLAGARLPCSTESCGDGMNVI